MLSVAKPLDREEIHHYELNITASDHGRPPRSSFQILHIFVEDVNDNPPHFKQHLYRANVSEAAPKGTFVLKVEATDIDLGEYKVLHFFGISNFCSDILNDSNSLVMIVKDFEFIVRNCN